MQNILDLAGGTGEERPVSNHFKRSMIFLYDLSLEMIKLKRKKSK